MFLARAFFSLDTFAMLDLADSIRLSLSLLPRKIAENKSHAIISDGIGKKLTDNFRLNFQFELSVSGNQGIDIISVANHIFICMIAVYDQANAFEITDAKYRAQGFQLMLWYLTKTRSILVTSIERKKQQITIFIAHVDLTNQIGGTYTICATWLRNDVKKNLDVSIPEKRTTHTYKSGSESVSWECQAKWKMPRIEWEKLTEYNYSSESV